MSVASALVAGNEALPWLAEQAVAVALEKIGEHCANGVLLFLTPEFARHAQQTVTAAARAARCTQLAGGIAAGVFTEQGWVLDRPAAAVMVFARGMSLGHHDAGPSEPSELAERCGEPQLCYAGNHLPAAWAGPQLRRFGGSYSGNSGRSDPVAWLQGRVAAAGSVQICGAHLEIGVSRGWRLLGDCWPVEASRAYDLITVGGESALDSLIRSLPPDCRSDAHLPLASLCAVLIDDAGAAQQGALAEGRAQPIAIIAANADRSLTLAERCLPGQRLAWAIRQPHSTRQDMQQTLERLAAAAPDPLAAVVFSCIGRGPYFYAGEDDDLACLCARFPGMPLIGAYGTGQIAALPGLGNRLLQNAVVTALISREECDVQSQP